MSIERWRVMGSSLAAREGRVSLELDSSVTLEECLCPEGLVTMMAVVAARRATADLPPTTSELERLSTEDSELVIVDLEAMLGGAGGFDGRVFGANIGESWPRLSRASV